MRALRPVYERMPPRIESPEDLRSRRVEVVLLKFEEGEVRSVVAQPDWPEGLFEHTAGVWQGERLQRAPQGEYGQRLDLD